MNIKKIFGLKNLNEVETEIIKTYFPNGKTESETCVKKGTDTWHGKRITYYQSGNIEEESYYQDGEKNGAIQCYFENGKLKSITNYQHGVLEGIEKHYYKSGKIKVVANWKNDLQDGVTKYYYESGALEEESNWIKGKGEGLVKIYYETGVLQEESNWKNDKKHGITKLYYKNGTLKEESNWKNDLLHGLDKWYYENGTLKREATFKNGLEYGVEKNFYETGELKMEQRFENDGNDYYRHGLEIWYYKNGQKQEEIMYEVDIPVGEGKYYFANGDVHDGISRQVIFPNPYGYELPTKNRVKSLQKQYGFTDDYASFLLIQNGFSFCNLKQDSNNQTYLKKKKIKPKGTDYLQSLYGIENEKIEDFILKEWFFPIATDLQENVLAEVLAGTYKGHIISIKRAFFISFRDVNEIIEFFKEHGFDNRDIQADRLIDNQSDMFMFDIGMIQIIANSIDDFIKNCIYCDGRFSGFIMPCKNLNARHNVRHKK